MAEHYDEHVEHGLGHVMPWKLLVGIWLALMVLTVLTVVLARPVGIIEWGYFSFLGIWVAMLVATVKALLVAFFFMHLGYDNAFHTFVIASGVVFAILFVAITGIDKSQYDAEDVRFKDKFATEVLAQPAPSEPAPSRPSGTSTAPAAPAGPDAGQSSAAPAGEAGEAGD